MSKKNKGKLVLEILLYLVALIIAAMGIYLIGLMYITAFFMTWERAITILTIWVMLPAIIFWVQGLINVSRRVGSNIARLKNTA